MKVPHVFNTDAAPFPQLPVSQLILRCVKRPKALWGNVNSVKPMRKEKKKKREF